jgi:SOS-response transcriptional repressor LexA
MGNTSSNIAMNPNAGASSTPLSTEQRRLAEAIRDWPAAHKLAPTLEELADFLGLVKSTVSFHRKRLRDLGLVSFDEGKSRSTRITNDRDLWAAYGLDPAAVPSTPGAHPDPGRIPRSRRARLGGAHAGQRAAGAPRLAAATVWALPWQAPRTLPVAGRIAAGFGKAFYPDDDVIKVEGGLAGAGRYALRVTGDSLVDLGIFDGDHVIVDPDQPYREGDIVAAVVPHEQGDEVLATIKIYVSRDGQPWLVAANENVPPLPIEGEALLGRVTTVIRRV